MAIGAAIKVPSGALSVSTHSMMEPLNEAQIGNFNNRVALGRTTRPLSFVSESSAALIGPSSPQRHRHRGAVLLVEPHTARGGLSCSSTE
jgi:hypothetical protein